MARFVIALGSSNRNGKEYIDCAIDKIKTNSQIIFHSMSSIYKNSSAGTGYNNLFYNCVCAVTSHLYPVSFYRELFSIELALGRIRTYRFSRRTMDIDVLMSLEFGLCTPQFALPHKEAFNRIFYVKPAIEALKLANWPMPFNLVNAQTKLTQGNLCPLTK